MHTDLLEMDRMRALLAIALLSFGIAGGSTVRAADLPDGDSGPFSAHSFGYGERAGMQLVYGDGPGVVVRAYWRAPWRHHHYFPATGEVPELGRDEDLNATGSPPRPAKTFKRTWSNAAALERARPIYMLPPENRPMSRQEPLPQTPELK
jgi:hypothetical protein